MYIQQSSLTIPKKCIAVFVNKDNSDIQSPTINISPNNSGTVSISG